MYQPIEHDEMLNPDGLKSATIILPLDDVKPSTAAAGTSPYVLDFSLMAIVFAILIFLWMQ
jgi:hypothetical protein